MSKNFWIADLELEEFLSNEKLRIRRNTNETEEETPDVTNLDQAESLTESYQDSELFFVITALVAFGLVTLIVTSLVCCCCIHKNLSPGNKVNPKQDGKGGEGAKKNWSNLANRFKAGSLKGNNSKLNNTDAGRRGSKVAFGGVTSRNGVAGAQGGNKLTAAAILNRWPRSKMKQTQAPAAMNGASSNTNVTDDVNKSNQTENDDVMTGTGFAVAGAMSTFPGGKTQPGGINQTNRFKNQNQKLADLNRQLGDDSDDVTTTRKPQNQGFPNRTTENLPQTNYNNVGGNSSSASSGQTNPAVNQNSHIPLKTDPYDDVASTQPSGRGPGTPSDVMISEKSNASKRGPLLAPSYNTNPRQPAPWNPPQDRGWGKVKGNLPKSEEPQEKRNWARIFFDL